MVKLVKKQQRDLSIASSSSHVSNSGIMFPFRRHGLFTGGMRKVPDYCSNVHIANYCASLTKGLDNLERTASTEFMSFSFVKEAIELLRSTHSGVLLLIEKLKLPVSPGEEWLNQYMDETVKILDVCNVLKIGVSALEHYRRLLGFVVRSLDTSEDLILQGNRGQQALGNCKQEMIRAKNERKNLIDTKIEAQSKLRVNLTDKHEAIFIRWNGFCGVLFALKNTSSYICRLLLSAVVYVGPIPPLTAEIVSMESPWCCSLVHLQQRVTYEIAKTEQGKKCTMMLSSDVEVLERLLEKLRVLLDPPEMGFGLDYEKLSQTVQSVKQNSQQFRTGVETVQSLVNDLFDEIVEGRKKLLNMCMSSTN